MNITNTITTCEDLVSAVAQAVRAKIPQTLSRLEDRDEKFSLYAICDAVVYLAANKWPGNFQPGQDRADMVPFLAFKIAAGLKENDLYAARIIEMY